MTKMQKLITEYCSDGVFYMQLSEVTQYAKTRINLSLIDEKNYVSVENLLQNKQGKINASIVPQNSNVIGFECGDILIGNIRPYLRKIWLADCNGGTNGDVLTIQINNKEQLIPKFLYYVLSSEQFFTYIIQNSKGAKMPRGDKTAVMKYSVPIPPLEVQHEIVRILDNFTEFTSELIEKLTIEFTARKKQYKYYRDKLFTFKNEKVKLIPLRKLAKFTYGYTDTAKENGDTRFIRITDIDENGGLNSYDARYITLSEKSRKYLLKKGDLLLARTGATYGKTLYYSDDEQAVYASFLIKISLDNDRILNRYYWHFSKSTLYWIQAERFVSKGGQQQFNTNAVGQIVVPVPSLNIQEKIVNVLDNFDTMCTDLNIGLPAEIEARKKQYEYYRDMLLTFVEDKNIIFSQPASQPASQPGMT